jgi:G3E family GTPase
MIQSERYKKKSPSTLLSLPQNRFLFILYSKILPGMSPNIKVPLVLVTGFLGSGKTTFLKFLLGNLDADLRIGIVQNEYASASIDTTELRNMDRKFEVLEVNNGSVFCVCLLGSFMDSLAEFTDMHSPDLLIIEASGLSDPIAIAEIMQQDKLARRVFLSSVWCIVDGQHYHKVSKMNTRVERQVMIADRILLNKSDLMEGPPDDLIPVLKKLNPEAEILTTTYCQVPLDRLQEPVIEPIAWRKKKEHMQYAPGGRADISTVVLRTSRPIDRTGLEAFVRETEGRLVRLKGFVLLSGQKIIRIQGGFGQTSMHEVSHYNGNTELIGLGWDISPSEFGRRFHEIRKSREQHVG